MGTKFFNSHEFKEALTTIYKDPFRAKLMYEDYLQKYPRDYCAYPNYIYVLVMLGEIEKADKILKYVQGKVDSDSQFRNEKSKMSIYSERIILAKIRILARQKKYQEICDYYLNSQDYLKEDFELIIYYCMNKLGLLDGERSEYRYVIRQMIEYHEEEFYDHIKKHQVEYNFDQKTPNPVLFALDFPIDKVVEEAKKYIPSEKRLCTGLFDDAYLFKYDMCGRVHNKVSNSFKIITFDGTKDFITMYPCSDNYNLPYVDLNYLQNEKPKVKTLSQIEKFNRRYKRN